jgi:hypothetical protein
MQPVTGIGRGFFFQCCVAWYRDGGEALQILGGWHIFHGASQVAFRCSMCLHFQSGDGVHVRGDKTMYKHKSSIKSIAWVRYSED